MVSPVAGMLNYHSMAHGWLIPILSGHTFCATPGGLQGLGLKGGAVPPGVYLTYHPLHQCSHPPPWGHIPQQLPCMCNWGLVPTQGYILTTCYLEDCLWMLSLKGVGPLVRSWGKFRNTLGSLRPLSGLCSLGKVPKIFFFSLLLRQLVIFL